MPRTAALALASLLTACGPAAADTTPPGPPAPRTARITADATDQPVKTSEPRPGVQTIEFDGEDPEPPTDSVRAAPKRPPIPRFQLFGTRPSDGP